MSDPVQKPKGCIEIGSATFAVIILISTTAGTIVTCVFLFVELSYLFGNGGGGDYGLTEFFSIVLSVAAILGVLAVAFSIVLVIGVFKRKSVFLFTYFVYGIVMTVGTLVGGVSIVFLFALEEFFTPKYIIPCIGALLIYLAILCMIWKTYKKIKTENLYTPATSVHVDLRKKENEITINYFDSKSQD
ncbi:hypothetical protein NE865_01734 [Phthorimaea operculella]|nr:hypothetical protein NE865_01734 [Phthorimaea operculella]